MELDDRHWPSVSMGLIDRLLGRGTHQSGIVTTTGPTQAVPELLEVPAADADNPPGSWYVPQDGNADRLVGPDGFPPLRLVHYRDTTGEHVLRLCENSTGLLVGPTDRRLPRARIFVSQLRGESYHQAACRAGNFHPGVPVRLVREPDNLHDRKRGGGVRRDRIPPGRLRQQAESPHARETARHRRPDRGDLHTRHPLQLACDQIAILATRPEVLQHLLSPRRPKAAKPAFPA